MTPPLSQTSRRRGPVIALYVGYGVILVPLIVVFSVALAFLAIGGSFIAPSAAFIVATALLWPAGLILSLVRRSLRIGYLFLGAVAIAMAGFVAWVALGT